MDFVLYWIDSGVFEFEKHSYPLTYHISSVRDEIFFHGNKADEKVRDISETWIPVNELPKDKKELLDNMIKEVK
jgi:hypothetical protein